LADTKGREFIDPVTMSNEAPHPDPSPRSTEARGDLMSLKSLV
jgi:hypothetical protein